MNVSTERGESAKIRVENIGGIDRTSITFTHGISVLAGRNATNRTSLLQAVMAACGSDGVSIKGDADEASVELDVGDATYTRTLSRRNGAVVSGGDPYLDDAELADLFAFLLESNEARRAVARGDDLRDLIMRPVDTAEIQDEIERLTDERKELETRLDELDQLKGRLPTLESDRTRLEEEIAEKRKELEAKEAEIEAADADVEETKEEKAELEDQLAELREKRTTLDDIRYELETERESLDSLRSERTERQSELSDLPEISDEELDRIESEMDDLRSRKRTLDDEIDDLQSIIQYNEQLLDGSHPPVADALGANTSSGGAVTDRLLEDQTVTCWTCGSEVESDQITQTVDRLRELSQEKLRTVSEIDSRLDELKSDQSDLEQTRRRRERLDRRLSTIEDEIDRRESRITELRERRSELEDEIETMEADVEAREEDSYSDILDLHREANQLEFQLGKLESDHEDVVDEITDVEDRLATEDQVEAELDSIRAEIEDLRTKVERIETQAIEEFNDHMDTILDLLDYRNLDRIWLERVERETRQGRRTVVESVFKLHVIRSTASGTAYEDTVDHLSESEREVTGLIFALAGYLAHDVHEQVPFMLLDSLEAIDSERIAMLVEYLREYPDYLVVALLPEDAAALDDAYPRITDI